MFSVRPCEITPPMATRLDCRHYGGDEAKNIHFGAGFQDAGTASGSNGGKVDLKKQDHPFAKSPAAQACPSTAQCTVLY